MVDVEIRRPYFDEESQGIEWQLRAIVRATTDGVKVSAVSDDFSSLVDEPVLEASTGELVAPSTEPERWARSLPDAYRAGDLVAVVVRDDEPSEIDALGDIDEPVIPEPPQPEFTDDQETRADEVTTVS